MFIRGQLIAFFSSVGFSLPLPLMFSIARKTRLGLLLLILCLSGILSSEALEIIAHRGGSEVAPENTLAAVRQAWKEQANACEVDLHLTADGAIVAIHDADTRRTTGVSHRVQDVSLAQLRRLDAGSWKAPDYAGERIPTLAEILQALPAGPQRLFLEIKCGPEIAPVLAKELASWHTRAGQLCVIAFDRNVARVCKTTLPWLPVYRLSSEVTREKQPVDLETLIRDTVADGLDGLNLSRKWPWSADFVARIRQAGLGVFVWTVNDAAEASRLAALGIDGITTDAPARLRERLAARP